MRRRLLVTSFVVCLLAVVLGLHLYLAQGLVHASRLEGLPRGAGLALLAIGAALLLAAPLAERTLPRGYARIVAWPAALWMGFAFLLLVLLAASDALLWLAGSAASAAALDAGAAGPRPARALGVVALAGLIGVLALRNGLRPPSQRRVEVPLRRWPVALDGLRVVQLSDVHIGTLLGRAFATRLVARVNALRPDLVVVTGDLVDGSVSTLRDEVAPFAGLRARHGVFFVTGNHDHYSGAEAWVSQVRRLGLRVLRNERVCLGDGDARFELAGVEDHHAHLVGDGPGEDLPAALAGRDPDLPLLLLAHDPLTFRQASRMGVDLQLSGHTHGGQLWPFTLLVRLFVPFVAGLYRRGDATLYVSRGTGFWGPPMRLLAPAEITELVLRAAPAPAAAR